MELDESELEKSELDEHELNESGLGISRFFMKTDPKLLLPPLKFDLLNLKIPSPMEKLMNHL